MTLVAVLNTRAAFSRRDEMMMKGYKIALVEDDYNIASSIKILLRSEGIAVQHFESAEEFCKSENGPFDLFLIDVNLPGQSGLDLCREIRKHNKLTPILFITASEKEAVAVEALSIGSQDFIRKPFRSAEFLARVHLHLKSNNIEQLSIGGVTLNFIAHRCTFENMEITLTRNEFCLMSFFLKNIDHVFSRAQLLDELRSDENTTDRTIDTTLSRLKSKLKKAGVESLVFESVYGEGYRVKIKK